jgi:hypothetical protein
MVTDKSCNHWRLEKQGRELDLRYGPRVSDEMWDAICDLLEDIRLSGLEHLVIERDSSGSSAPVLESRMHAILDMMKV